jgi:ABC-type nitrate/sulfonate/bicarbonate transport system substrate-binding protein
MLKANNMTVEQLNLVDIGFGIQPLLVDQVDAVVGFAMGMPEEAERAGVPIHELLISDYGVNAYSLMLVCSQTFMDSHPKLVSGFLTSTLKGVTDTIADHDAALDALTKSVDETDRDIEAEVLKRTVPYWSDDKGSHGTQSEQQWKDTVRIAHDLGLVSSAPAVTDIYTNDFIEQR